MPPKKKSVKKTKKIKKAKLQKEQKVKLFADFDVLGEEKKENESTSLSPDIQNDNIISKLEDDESDKDSPDVSAHISHIEATEVIKENDSEETVELSLESKTQSEDDEDWETVKPKKSKKKKIHTVNKEYANIAKLYSYKGHERDKKSINLIYKRYKFYENLKWDAQQIREQLHIKEDDNVKISQKYYNVEDILPQDETYKEFYILFSSRNEVLDEDIRPGTPRFVISSSTGDIYFTNHYDEFINVKTGKKFK